MSADITGRGELRAARLVSPILERFRTIGGVSLVAAVAVAIITLAIPRKFEASISLSTMSSTRNMALSGGLPAALLAASNTGLQPTPALLTTLARSRNVISEVARTPVAGRGSTTIIDALVERDASADPDDRVYKKIQKILAVGSDRETGLVFITVTHKDSALARFAATRMVDGITNAFRTAAHAQATEQRQSLQARLDTASGRLQRAERASREFASTNRVVAPYSLASIEAGRLERELRLAETIYNQVVTESESAKGRELEETPSVVIVDPIPRQLTPVSRHVGSYSLAALFFAFLFIGGVVSVADLLRGGESTAAEDQERMDAALRALLNRKPASRPPASRL